jgi:hypothetical protein
MSIAVEHGIVAATVLASGGPVAGKAAFIGVFVLLLFWLLLMPRRLVADEEARMPWWRNSRVWAVLIVLVQIVVYYRWG